MCLQESSLWVFSYGSLIFRPGFHFVESRKCYIKGFARRFFQESPNHRGTPEAPGRVVTLLPVNDNTQSDIQSIDIDPSCPTTCGAHLKVTDTSEAATSIVWGMAYRIHADHTREVLKSLDKREKGYDRRFVQLHLAGDLPFQHGIVYVGRNQLLSPIRCTHRIAEIIATSKGISGPNSDYLLRLSAKIREWGVVDNHLFELERLVLQLYQKLPPPQLCYRTPHHGTIYIDLKRIIAISNCFKPLYLKGVKRVDGDFAQGEVIEIRCEKNCELIAKGISNLSSKQLLDHCKSSPKNCSSILIDRSKMILC